MSVYFSIQNDPMHVEFDPEFGEMHWHAWGSMNLAQLNAQALTQLLGLPWDYGTGRLELEDMPELARRIIRCRNTDEGYAPLLREAESSGNRHIMGVDSRRAVDYLDAFLALIQEAQERGEPIVWS